jgi:MoaA/NifB/PqqE/SkfB family radical SAM enzyme
VKQGYLLRAWHRVLLGYPPAISVEVTKRCPLKCPGCYAYSPHHYNGNSIAEATEFRSGQLVDEVLKLTDIYRPLVVWLVGGEPLVRVHELNRLLPELSHRGIEARLVTSAVRRIPNSWSAIEGLKIIVSVDGLPAEHDARRKPATYDRVLGHLEGQNYTVHCTLTRPMLECPGYLKEFLEFWSPIEGARGIWISFYTPQDGERSPERLTFPQKEAALVELIGLRKEYPKLLVWPALQQAYLYPPAGPHECIFARATLTLAPDLKTVVEPCQLGGRPVCQECGCMASGSLHAVGAYRLPGGIRVGALYEISSRIGALMRRFRGQPRLHDNSSGRGINSGYRELDPESSPG